MVEPRRKWSNLSPQLLSLIGDRLDSSIDVLRFRSVCISWRRSVPPFHLPSPLPYINPPDTNPTSVSTGRITETSVYRLQNPSTSPPKSFLIKLRQDPYTRQMKLMNPLSDDEIDELPETFPTLLNLYDLRITKICSFYEARRLEEPDGFMDYEPVARLTLSTGDVVVVRMGIFSLHVLNVRDKRATWRLLSELQRCCFFSCIVNFNGKVYALDTEGYCSVVDADLNVTKIGSPMSKDYKDWKHLVGSHGELLLVNRLTAKDEDSCNGTIGFGVYWLDEEGDRWVPVTNLGDRILFVGRGCSFSVSASDFGCSERNCIFILGVRDDEEAYEEDEYDGLRGFECWEPEILSLEDNSVRTLVSSAGCGDIFWPPPSWLSPVGRSSILRKKMDSTEEEQQEIVETTLDLSPGSEGEDIISSLPNSILCHILSKLPTKYAVGTSILSSQWRHLFPSIPNPRIDIDDTLLLHPPDAADGGPHQSTRNIHFINFISHLFNVTLRDVPRFSDLCLHFHHDYGNLTIKELISAASRFQVSHLDLQFTVDGCGVSFDDLRSFTSLGSLFLTQECALPVPNSLMFFNLTKFILCGATFTQSDGLERVLNACPLLKHLGLDRCHFPASDVLCISVPNLKMLMIFQCYFDDMYEIVIHTPNLEWFAYNDAVAESYPLIDFSSLQQAAIHLGLNKDQLEEDDWSVYYVNAAEIIRACYNVTRLFLEGVSINVSCKAIHPLPIFRNLIELSLGNLNVNGWELLPHFLQNSPNLRDLIFQEGIKDHEGCYSRFESCLPGSVPECLSSRLLKIKFEGFKGEEDELKLVEYFLGNAMVLRVLKVCLLLTLPMEEMKRIWSCVKALPKGSKNCLLRYM